MSGTVLILGATGRFGRHAADAFWNAGWRVRQFTRGEDLNAAAQGADLIVNAWNPAYPDWARDVPKMTEQVIAAAKASGAAVLIPGNMYVYGAGAPGILSERTPHGAKNALGRVRVEMEAAYRASGVPTIILRAGDFIDTQASGNWFDMVIAKRAKQGVMIAPGDTSAPHAWAYLPDLARAAVAIATKRERLPTYQEVLFPGYSLSLDELADLVERATNVDQTIRSFSWFTLWLAQPFWRIASGLREMSYLWSMPHRVDPALFNRLVPGFSATDPLTAVASALDLDVDPHRTMAGRVGEMPA